MNDNSQLRNKAISGFLWSLVENGGSYILHFFIGLILIRLIEPVNYGIIGMMSFFIVLGTSVTDFGLSTALVQAKEPSDEEFSSVFWANIFISLAFYTLIFIFSELIAQFYDEEIITFTIKIFALNFVISSFGVVHTTKISRNLNYKLWTRINLTSLLIAGIISIILALYGYGLWSLIFIQLIQNFVNTVQLWILCDWNHGFNFSFKTIKNLSKFSSSIVIVNLINSIYNELYYLLVGRLFKAEQLAYYLRARQTAEIFSQQFTITLNKVMLPVFSNLQDDKIALQRAFHKVIIMTGFINFSVLAFLSANAESLFVLLYTDSWISAVPFFQLLCIEGMFLPLHILAGNLLIAKGKSQKFMYIEISKRIFQAAIIYFSLESIEIIIYGQLTIAILYTLIGFVIAQIEIEYKFLKQIKTLFPYILIAGFIFVLNFYLFELFRNFGYFISIFINLIISLIFYITIGYVFKIEAFQEIFNVLTDRMKFQKSKLK